MALRKSLHEVTGEIGRINHGTLALARRFLPHFEELLEVLLGGSAGQPSYTAGGEATRAGRLGMSVVDMQA